MQKTCEKPPAPRRLNLLPLLAVVCLAPSAPVLGEALPMEAPASEIASPATGGDLLSPTLLPLMVPGLEQSQTSAEGQPLVSTVQISRGPRPEWAIDMPLPEITPEREKQLLERTQLADGVLYLLNATQVNATEIATHTELVRKVLTVRGAQSMIRLAIPFNPAFEKLEIHEVALMREGERLDRLNELSFRLYQKEDRAAELIYRGAVQAVAFIPDLRPGDTLRYSYTLRGGHPLFGRRFDDLVMMNVRGTEERRIARVLSSAETPLQWAVQGGRLEPETRALPGGLLEQTWKVERGEVPTAEENLPQWYWPFPVLQLSHFKDWAESGALFAPLYTPPVEKGTLYIEALEKIRAAHTEEQERIQAALDVVRDDVRYLSLSEGEAGYRPRELEEVLATRLGDCKDKTRLLCALLTDLGLEAYPALVSTRERDHLKRIAPTPHAFDHVVVELRWKGRKYWLDGTINQASRDFRHDFFPYFGYALVLAPDTTDLSEIGSVAQASKRVRVRKKFRINGSNAPTQLQVTSIYSGAAAFQERELQAQSGRQALDAMLLELNASRYDALMLGKPRKVQDDLKRNQVTSIEEYIIPNLWQDPEGEGRNIAIFHTSELPAMLYPQFSALPRRQPLQVEHPVHLSEEIEILSPVASQAQPKEYEIKGPAFTFRHQVQVEGTTLRLLYEYTSTRDHVPAADTAAHLEKLNQVIALLAYSIRYPREFGVEEQGPLELTPQAGSEARPRSTVRGGRGVNMGIPIKR